MLIFGYRNDAMLPHTDAGRPACFCETPRCIPTKFFREQEATKPRSAQAPIVRIVSKVKKK